MNVMLVSVTERTGEIGLLKALGAGRRQILRVFLAEAALLSIAGGLVGLVVGCSRCGARHHLPHPAGAAAPLGGGAALALSVVVGVVFGVVPARRATRLDPVTALGGGSGARPRTARPAPCAATACARCCRCSASPSASPR